MESAFYWGHRDNKILGNGESLNIILGNVLFDSYHWGRVFILLHTLGLERLYLFNLIVVIGAGYLFYYIFWDWKDFICLIGFVCRSSEQEAVTRTLRSGRFAVRFV